ncbi:MAGE family-domain-containing protein [Clohesyomyces aquaticus]|uniref:MAGE family-domain-containing protein n=1 Tax=Clohesyomyces aquaticus TaxID=1231657 RepID=A0A1Y1YT06_9PLEO|nr:MAGE family-domain-containing protein [Clohesyomyces aquaticus]
MVELPNREKVTLRQKRAAATSESQSKTSGQWVLQTALPDRLRIPEIISPPSVPTAEIESSYVGFYSMIISLISLSGGSLPEGRLDRFLKRMNAETSTPVDRTDKVLARMIKEGYIVKIKDSSSGEDIVDYMVGPRGKAEVGDEGVANLVRTVSGNGIQDLEQRLNRSLGIAERSAPGEASQAAVNGAGGASAPAAARRGPGRPRRRIPSDEDGDGDGDEGRGMRQRCSGAAVQRTAQWQDATAAGSAQAGGVVERRCSMRQGCEESGCRIMGHGRRPPDSTSCDTTMASIDSLLNHDPAPEQQPRRSSSTTHSASSTAAPEPLAAKTTTFDAADALTTLATLGSGQHYAPVRELPSPTAFTSHAPRRTSSFGSLVAPVAPVPPVAPVEPSPPMEQALLHSPTLDQYHHGSKSPEEQRRQSLFNRTSPAPILAPIQSLTTMLHDRIHDEPPSATPYGKDVSQMVSPPSRSSDGGESARHDTQNREPALVRGEPTVAQAREPEEEEVAASTTPPPISTNPPLSQASDSQSQLPSPLPFIKHEPSGTPREATPIAAIAQSERHNSVTTENMDADTLKAIEAVKQSELGLRAKKAASESVASPTESKPTMAPSKKRPAPGTSAIKKKGTAAPKKPASKKRKLDSEMRAERRSGTPSSRTSKAPTTKNAMKGSQAGTPAAESSPAPDHSSQIHPTDDEGDSSEDSTLYCICRKPDNHTWMIGCDGGCDDWFHGACVNMQQTDEKLVDKFICPNCEANGRGQTTWKAMCRRSGCGNPAVTGKGKESKYCSEACGILFFQDQLQRTAGAKKAPSTSKKSKKKGAKEDNGEDSASAQASGAEDEPIPLGGVLRAKDLKALAVGAKDIEAFKRLGAGVLSPPQTASPTKATFNSTSPPSDPTALNINLSLTPAETMHLNALHTEKTDLKIRLEVLKDREKFVSMVREQALRRAEKEKLKSKEFCGYDSRLAWSDTEFLRWRGSMMGKAAFKWGTLSPSKEQWDCVTNGVEGAEGGGMDGDGDVPMANGDANSLSPPTEKDLLCTKKRCPKHPNWQKLQLQDARFEEMEVVEAIKECEKEERAVRERAMTRGAKRKAVQELVGEGQEDDGGERERERERNREGWVEVVEAV